MTIERASDNPFPSILLVEGDPEALAVDAAAGQRRLAVGTDHLLYLVDDAGTATLVGSGASDLDAILAISSGQDIADALTGAAAPDAGNVFATMADVGVGGSGGILAVTRYNPGSDGTYAVTGTSLADLDATNAKVTFTAPASGAALILVDVLCSSTANGGDPSWEMGLRESSSQVGNLQMIANGTQSIARRAVSFYVSGIAAGSHTYKLASFLATSGGTGTVYFGSTTRGGVNMTVFAA